MLTAGAMSQIKTRTFLLEDLKGRDNLGDTGVRVRQ
jgi:hypothetical protein